MATIEMKWERRPVSFVPKYDNDRLGIKRGDGVEGYALGLFQCADDDGSSPYFVVELMNGYCTYVAPEDIKFIGGIENAKNSD